MFEVFKRKGKGRIESPVKSTSNRPLPGEEEGRGGDIAKVVVYQLRKNRGGFSAASSSEGGKGMRRPAFHPS